MICDRLGREDRLGIHGAIGSAQQSPVRARVEASKKHSARSWECREGELNRGVERAFAGVAEDHRRRVPNQRAGPIRIRGHGLLGECDGR